MNRKELVEAPAKKTESTKVNNTGLIACGMNPPSRQQAYRLWLLRVCVIKLKFKSRCYRLVHDT